MNASNGKAIRVVRVSPLDVRELRYRVLWPHKAKLEDCLIDIDESPDAIHLGAFISDDEPWGIQISGMEGAMVGACSLFHQHCTRTSVPWKEGEDVRLRVMGTLPEVRGWGAGAELIAKAAYEVRLAGRRILWCDAREVAFGFYERMGFGYLNEVYDIPEIGPHRTMALDVSSLPH